MTAFGGLPMAIVGGAHHNLWPGGSALFSSTLSLTQVNAGTIYYGQIFTEDGGSHTIDTTGSSHLQFRMPAITWANAGSTAVVGLASPDLAAGPPARPINAAGIITPTVSKTFVGGTGFTSNAWNTLVPDAGTMTIANGDLVCFFVQLTARAGVDSVSMNVQSSLQTNQIFPAVTTVSTAGVFAATVGLHPNAVIQFSDGVFGYFYGSLATSVAGTNQIVTNASAIREAGNLMQFPIPIDVYGIQASIGFAGDGNFVLYTAPMTGPTAQRTLAIDANFTGSAAGGNPISALFATPYTVPANTPFTIAYNSTVAAGANCQFVTLGQAAHQSQFTPVGGYGINRGASGNFAIQNSQLDRYLLGAIIGGASGAGTSGFSGAYA